MRRNGQRVGQEEFAMSAGVGTHSVQRLEQGRGRQISLVNFVLCARGLGKSPDELLQLAREKLSEEDLAGAARLSTPFTSVIGRDEALEEIVSELNARDGVILCGAPGQGKTSLAQYVANSIGDHYRDGVCDVGLESETQVENLPRRIAAALDLGEVPNSFEILADKRVLVVLDAVDRMRSADERRFNEALTTLVRSSPKSKFIVTCQQRLEKKGFATIDVVKLDPAFAVQLFQRESDGQYDDCEQTSLTSFADGLLAGHPLSIKIVGRYGRAASLPLQDLVRLWRDRWDAIAAGSPMPIDERGLRASFELAFEALSRDAQILFLSMSLLPDGVVPGVIQTVWGKAREAAFHSAMMDLRQRSLLDERPVGFSNLNRLSGPLYRYSAVKRAETAAADVPMREELLAAVLALDDYLDQYVRSNAPQFGDAEPEEKNRAIAIQFHNIHASLDRRLEPSSEPKTIAAATSVLSLYWAYRNNLSGAHNPISSTEDAIRYLDKAQAVFLGSGRKEDASRCTYYIGNIYWLRGDVYQARKYLHEIEELSDAPEEMRLDVRRAFAHIEYKEGDIRTAINEYLEIKTTAAGRFREIELKCVVGLLDAYRKLLDFEAASALFADYVEALPSAPPPIAGNILRGHAYALASSGDLSSAEVFYRQALEVFRGNAFSQAHCWRGLGDIRVARAELTEAEGNFATAERLYEQARKVPSLGVCLVQLGRSRLLRAAGKTLDALSVCADAAKQLDRAKLNEPYEFAIANEMTGDLQSDLGDADKARAAFRIAISYFGRVGALSVADRIAEKLRAFQS